MTRLTSPPNLELRPNARSVALASRLSSFAGLLIITVAVVVLLGWMWNQPALTAFFGPITMKTNAAIGLLLCGAALLLRARAPIVSAGLGAAAACIGGVTMFEHISGWDLGVDQLLFTEPPGAVATTSPNRMGPNASISLLLAGTALVLLAVANRRARIAAQGLACIGVALALLAIAGFVYGATQLYAIARLTGIAWHTAVTLLVMHLGILVARTDAGPMARVVSDGPEGTMLRRQFAPVTIVPFIVGYLVLRGTNANLYDRGLSVALLVLSLMVLLWLTMWHTARALEQSDQQRRGLERGVDQLLIRERQARDEAERANRLKDQFIATLSHELRTPLNVMLGWTRVLESGSRPEQHTHAAAVVARNGRLLARLIEDLLDISRAAAGQFDVSLARVSLNPIAQAAIDAVTPVASAKSVKLTTRLDPRIADVDADVDRLQQVISNLLSNAVKFTPAGGEVELRTTSIPGGVQLDVIDTGIGFDAAFVKHIFEPFRQADPSTRREHGGLGLGLSIARHLVQLHRGSITASSDGPGQGARFTVTLPASDTRPATPPADLEFHAENV